MLRGLLRAVLLLELVQACVERMRRALAAR